MSYDFNGSPKVLACLRQQKRDGLTTSDDPINDRGILPLGLSLDMREAGMPNYMIWLERSVSCPIVIEADTENEACDEALYLNPDELDWEDVEYHVFHVDKLSEELR